MNKKTKNQHFVPQFYLKLFAEENGKFSVWDIKKNLILNQQQPRNFAAARYFYDMDENQLKQVLEPLFILIPTLKTKIDLSDSQFFEHYFSRCESNAKRMFDSILQNPEELFVKENQHMLILFLYSLSKRTEYFRKELIYLCNEINKHIEGMKIQNKEKVEKYDAKSMHMSEILDIINMIEIDAFFIEDYEWFIGYNKSDINFIIGDNPATDICTGMNDICFPISPRKAIIFRSKKHTNYLYSKDKSIDGKTIDLSLRSIILYDYVQISHSYRYCFGDKKTFDALNEIYKIAGISLMNLSDF